MGAHLPDPAASWAANLAARLAADLGPVEVVNRLFSPEGGPALAYLERTLDKHAPDVVIVKAGVAAFGMVDVEYAVRDRFGERAAAAFSWTEQRFTSAARRTGALGRTVDSAARTAARRTLGRAPLLSEEVGTATWLEALDLLARREEVQTIVTAPWLYSTDFTRAYPHSMAMRERFGAALQASALRHRFAWVDLEPALELAPGGRDACFLPDWVHTNALGHAGVLDILAPAVVAALSDRSPGAIAPPRAVH